MRTALASLVAVLAIPFHPPAIAAVRECGEIVSSDVVEAATEVAAKKLALDQWHVKAQKLGTKYDSWRMAVEKSLKCFPKGDGFDCVAFGRPCIIEQVPKVLPKSPGNASKGI